MARCRCAGDICSCAIEAGPGIVITGSGGINDPYKITLPIGTLLVFADSPDVTFTTTGAGTTHDPFVVTAGIPFLDGTEFAPAAIGTVLTKTSFGRYQPLPVSSAPGAINVGEGISGDGTVATPLRTTFPTYGSLKAVAS